MFPANKQDKRSNAFSCDRYGVSAAHATMSIFCRDLIDLSRRVPFASAIFAADDFRDLVLSHALARNRRPPPLRDLVQGLFTGCRLSAPFETALARLTAFRTGRPSAAAFPTRAPDHSANDCASRAGYAADRRTSYGPSCLLRNWRNLKIFR